MVRDTEQMKRVERPRGGKGSLELHEIMDPEELAGRVTLFAKVVLQPWSEIGYHQHVGETEAYYVLSGRGVFQGGDGERTEVKPGDICTIDEGQSHGMINTEDREMELIAVVIEK